MHPFRKDLVGKDMKDFRSDDGVRIYYDQVEAAKAGGGFVNYRWAKPGSKGDVGKVAYAGLNYKDALAQAGRGNVVRDYPRIGGIDRLAEHFTVQHHFGVRTEHPRLRT
ncbi:hypothetical protein G6F61_014620 [Rhizopus arrhizus]|nr:hypothetical protein G6F61_014620 [Rhizopus arrhizus]